MEIDVFDETNRQLKEIMIKGGEIRVIVERRGNERVPIIFTYPENKVRCKTETLTE
jgi:hypothetical protein